MSANEETEFHDRKIHHGGRYRPARLRFAGGRTYRRAAARLSGVAVGVGRFRAAALQAGPRRHARPAGPRYFGGQGRGAYDGVSGRYGEGGARCPADRALHAGRALDGRLRGAGLLRALSRAAGGAGSAEFDAQPRLRGEAGEPPARDRTGEGRQEGAAGPCRSGGGVRRGEPRPHERSDRGAARAGFPDRGCRHHGPADRYGGTPRPE